jgi:hypothetical protein
MDTRGSTGVWGRMAAVWPEIAACFVLVAVVGTFGFAWIGGCEKDPPQADSGATKEIQALAERNRDLERRMEALRQSVMLAENSLRDVKEMRDEASSRIAALMAAERDKALMAARSAALAADLRKISEEASNAAKSLKDIQSNAQIGARSLEEIEKVQRPQEARLDELRARVDRNTEDLQRAPDTLKGIDVRPESSEKRGIKLKTASNATVTANGAGVAETKPVVATSSDIGVTLNCDELYANAQAVNIRVNAYVYNNGKGTAQKVMLRVWVTKVKGIASGGGLVCLDQHPKGMTAELPVGDVRAGEMRQVFVTITYVDTRSGNTAGTIWSAELDYDVTVR